MPPRPTSRILWPVVWTLVGIGALAALFVHNATAREVVLETAKTIFGIVSTPFILETTFALIGIFIVLAVNHWRIKREGDGWVYLVTHEPDAGAAPLPAAITQRLQSVVMRDRPSVVDEAGVSRLVVEGFLEMGMAAQAKQELSGLDDLPDDEITAALHIRVLAANLETAAASALLSESSTRFVGHRQLFAQTALACAEWLQSHAPQQDEAIRLWQGQAAGTAV